VTMGPERKGKVTRRRWAYPHQKGSSKVNLQPTGRDPKKKRKSCYGFRLSQNNGKELEFLNSHRGGGLVGSGGLEKRLLCFGCVKYQVFGWGGEQTSGAQALE